PDPPRAARRARRRGRPSNSPLAGVVVHGMGAELDGLPVRCMSIRVGPGLLALEERRRTDQAFGCDETLQRRQPVLVITRSIVRVATLGGCFDFIGERRRPFVPGEMAL